MRTAGKARKGNQQYEEYEEDEYSNKKEGPSSYNANNNSSENNNNNKDAKNNDKANVIRSKHSVTEQRRRSKINERFQILRDLIPHSDQKRDTASFLLEVIEYVQYLQENVQKYDGSYQGWTSEPTKLVPWRNSHWRVPSFIGHPQGMMNGSGSTPAFPVKFDENNVCITPTVLASIQNPVESDPSREIACKATDCQPDDVNKGINASMNLSPSICTPVRSDRMLANTLQVPLSDAQSIQCPTTDDTLNQHEDLVIEGGTISISSAYSQGLLNTLAQALQNAGLDLSQASVSVQIDLGKRENSGLTAAMPISKDYENPSSSNQTMVSHRDGGSGEESDHVQKRLKT